MASISGGDALLKVLAALSDVPSITMNVGVLAGSTNEDTGELIAPYAAADEFGTSTIPARPAFRITVAEKTGDWASQLASGVSNIAGDPESIEKAFNQLGLVMVQDIRDTIEEGVAPENAESTVKAKTRKGRAEPDKTLIDSGSYQRAIDYEIIKGE
ncbi:hypothetical protein [Serratia fonticola]